MLVTDLDDTLLRRDKTISGYTLAVLRRCREAGIKTVIATGRGHPEVVAPLELFDGVIANNGANITDGDFKSQRYIPYAEARPLLLACHKHGLRIALNFKGTHYTNFDCSQVWPHITDFELVDLASHALDSEKICFEGLTPRDAEFVEQHLADNMYLKVARDGLGMVMHKKATKSAAIAELAERWGITRDEIVAFGDDLNDIDMLSFVGIGVAVENALDEVKAVADCICGDCDDDGVARWVENLYLWRVE